MLGLILCGGESSRMGQDKGLLQKDNTTWAGRSMEMMTGLVQNVAVSVNKNQWYRYSKDLVSKKRIELNAFVPIAIGMNNHVHFIWQALQSFTPSQNQASFMKFTARQLLRSLFKDDNGLHSSLKVNKYDRNYRVWKREPLSIKLLNKSMFEQKLEYIHYNPVRAGLCNLPEDYYYSSARFYCDGKNSFGMLKHYSGN